MGKYSGQNTESDYEGFLRSELSGIYKVRGRRVSPESLLATEALVKQLWALRNIATGPLLDVGCSTKPYLPLFSEKATLYVGIDVPFTSHTKKFTDAFARGEQLPFRSGTFDTILCTEVLEHVPFPGSCIEEIARVLTPGGTVLITTPFMYRVHEAPYDFFRYTPFAMEALANKAGLQVRKVVPRGGYLLVLADLLIKGITLALGAVRHGLTLHNIPQIDRPFQLLRKAVLIGIQKILWLILKNESLASARFTLGYVFVLKKIDPLSEPN